MILLTIVTGIVDAVAYLKLGHVFVANMTGNVVFLGFATAGAGGLSVAGSLLALACFLPGGIAAGRLAARLGDDLGSGSRYALIAILALAMGVQNATARRLAVTDLTTTVLTLTLTGIAADSWLGGGSGARTARRVLAVIAMLLGAIVGALLLLQVAPAAPLALATGILAVVCGAAYRASRHERASDLNDNLVSR